MSSKARTIERSAVLVTGANRGLGRALVEEALRRGATRVYAGARQPLAHPDERVTPLRLDVTDPVGIRQVVEQVDWLDILINNAGVSVADDLSERSAFERHLAVNLYGTLDVTQAFLPALTHSNGAVVNVVSIAALAAVPVLPAYSASKAASLSLTQSLRAMLAGQGVDVHVVLPGPIDTEMVRDLPIAKTPPRVGRTGDPRRTGAGRGGDLPRPAVGDAGRRLARGSCEGARAPERDAGPGGAPRQMRRMGNGGGRNRTSVRQGPPGESRPDDEGGQR